MHERDDDRGELVRSVLTVSCRLNGEGDGTGSSCPASVPWGACKRMCGGFGSS